MIEFENLKDDDLKELDDISDECKEKHESVSHNLILTGFKPSKILVIALYNITYEA